MAKVTVSVALTRETFREVDELCKKYGLSRSAFIELLLRIGLSRLKSEFDVAVAP